MKPQDPIDNAREPPASQPGRRSGAGAGLEQQARKLYRFLLHRLRGAQDADDLLQTVFLRFWQNPQRELVQKPEAYLYQIASHVLIEHQMKRRRSPVMFDSEAASESAEQAANSDVWSDAVGNREMLAQQLERVLQQIPPMYRAALVLRTCEGLSFEELGVKLGLSKKTAKTYVSRAIACCRLADWNR
jgi:RNA polymerase sigma factor (sigma-70 family)